MTELEYSSFQAALQRATVDISPAECHGQLCGLLCSLPSLDFTQWLDMAMPELVEACKDGDALAQETRDLLQQLFEDSEAGIQDRELGFVLFLSDDEQALANRLEELAEWCSGFLMGLAMGGIKEYKGLPDDIPEFLQDMLEISRAGSFELDNEEEDEDAYMELIEYVRMGVMLVRMGLHQLHSSGDDEPISIH